jgi:hypothetical protein
VIDGCSGVQLVAPFRVRDRTAAWKLGPARCDTDHLAWRRWAAPGVLAAVICSCSGDDAERSDAPLRDAAQIDAERADADAGSAELGDVFDVDDVAVTVGSITVVEEPDSSDRPFFVVHVRAENESDDERATPDVQILCGDSTEAGDSLAYSTYLADDSLPPSSFREGFAWRTGPGDPRTGVAPTDCVAPAYLSVTAFGQDEVRIELTGEMIAALNDEGCAADSTVALAEATIVANPLVCATFGTGPTPETHS